MQDLFHTQQDHIQLPRGTGEKGELLLYPDWLGHQECNEMFACLAHELNWQTERLLIYGRMVLTPRLTAWYGDPSARYHYSGHDHLPQDWHPLLLKLKNRLSTFLQMPFNSVLANQYRDGHDCMGWHADDEPELGPAPCIASLSLGASRFFDIRSKHERTRKARLSLHSGSLLVMRGELQQHWQHQVPRQLRIRDRRINLTFRQVLT